MNGPKCLTLRCGLVILLAAVFAAFVSPAKAEQDANTVSSPLKFSRKSINLGKIAQGTIAKTKFAFRNESDLKIEIVDVRTDCDCTVSEMGFATIAPKGTGEIPIAVNTKDKQPGPFVSKIALIYRANGKNLTALLEVKADIHVEGKLISDPEIFRLNDVLVGDPIKQSLTMKNAVIGHSTAITKVVGPDWLKFSFARKGLFNNWTIDITGTVPDKPGRLRDEIVVHTDHKTFDKTIIKIRGLIGGVVQAVPEFAYKPVVETGGNRTAWTRIEDKKKRKIEKIEITSGRVFRECTTKVEVIDGPKPYMKTVRAAIRDGLPKGTTLTLKATANVTVDGKVYKVPMHFVYLRQDLMGRPRKPARSKPKPTTQPTSSQ